MKGKILITDSLFIFPEHEDIIKNAGYEIERLNKSEPSEEELIEAIKGKSGYILGGIEKLNDKIIDSSDKLKAIVFTGIGYKDFIPNHEYITRKGIYIANTPDGPTHAVAEWAITMALAMNRNIFDLGRTGDKVFLTTNGLEDQKIGIIGLGRIGKEIINLLKVFKTKSIVYTSKNRHEKLENELGIKYCDLNKTLSESDIIFICVSSDAGKNFIDKNEIKQIKNGALLVSFMHDGIINEEALMEELKNGRIRAVSDYPMKSENFKTIPLSNWYFFSGSNAFNTYSALRLTSDMATKSIINLLEKGMDENKVN